MEELREVALAYYHNCNPELQLKAWEFFRSMDTNGDQRISPREFKEFLSQSGYNTIFTDPNFFAKLDRNGDRGLDFQEVLTFYYIIKTGYTFCRGCGIYLSGFYFTCFECFQGADPFTFDLCHDCHRSHRFTHHHTHFWENHKLLYYKRGPDNNMAMGYQFPYQYAAARDYYYNSATPELRNLAVSFFHCRQCSGYLNGLYFICIACFEGGAHHSHHYDPGSYNLCRACYRNTNFSHHHSYFLDNHILLRSKRGRPPYAAPHLVSAPQQSAPAVYNNNCFINNYHLPAVQPVPAKNNWLSYFNLLEVAVSAANLAANCSIM